MTGHNEKEPQGVSFAVKTGVGDEVIQLNLIINDMDVRDNRV